MYDKVIQEMKKRMEQKENHYRDFKAKQKAELADMSQEIEYHMDRRRRRKKQTGS